MNVGELMILTFFWLLFSNGLNHTNLCSQFFVGLTDHGNKLAEKKTAHMAFDEDSSDGYEMVFAILRL